MFHLCNEPVTKQFLGDILCLSTNYFVIKKDKPGISRYFLPSTNSIKKTKANNVLLSSSLNAFKPHYTSCGTLPH